SDSPAISADGRSVAFRSDATNLVPGDTNNRSDVFVRDLVDGRTERVSVGSDGAQVATGSTTSPSISSDGRYVAFDSTAVELVPGDTNGVSDVFVHDRLTSLTERVSLASDGTQGTSVALQSGVSGAFTPTISNDGRTVAFTSDMSNQVQGFTAL